MGRLGVLMLTALFALGTAGVAASSNSDAVLRENQEGVGPGVGR